MRAGARRGGQCALHAYVVVPPKVLRELRVRPADQLRCAYTAAPLGLVI